MTVPFHNIDGKIIDGPSKWHLMQALFAGEEIEFRLRDEGFYNNVEQFVHVKVRALANEISQSEISQPIQRLNPPPLAPVEDSWLMMGYLRVYDNRRYTHAVLIAYSAYARQGLIHAVYHGDKKPLGKMTLPSLEKWKDVIFKGQAPSHVGS
jgi:hypothetical protein